MWLLAISDPEAAKPKIGLDARRARSEGVTAVAAPVSLWLGLYLVLNAPERSAVRVKRTTLIWTIMRAAGFGYLAMS